MPLCARTAFIIGKPLPLFRELPAASITDRPKRFAAVHPARNALK